MHALLNIDDQKSEKHSFVVHAMSYGQQYHC